MARCTETITFKNNGTWECACGMQGTSWDTTHTTFQGADDRFMDALLGLMEVEELEAAA